MSQIILDTTAIYALAFDEDAHHRAAAKFFKRAAQHGTVFLVSDTIFDEAMTLLKVRRGLKAALTIGAELRNSRPYLWTPLTSEDEQLAWEIFQKYDDKDWSYTDCGVFALASRLRAPVFSFDHHFTQMPGLKRLPV